MNRRRPEFQGIDLAAWPTVAHTEFDHEARRTFETRMQGAGRSVQYNRRAWHHILNERDTCARNEAPSAVKLSVKSFAVSILDGKWRIFMIPSATSRTRTGNGCNVARAEVGI
jgi:hypothetical protein